MEAGNRGASDVGTPSIGFNIKLPFEQHANPYITPELNMQFRYFFIRKFWFLFRAQALIVFPGGFGTLDEMFEALTLIQTHKLYQVMPVVLFGTEY
jgi:predicted Rossmann-fold nucleotide-binding protein